MSKFLYHFEQKKGWMNDPNGCVFFKGRWHMFFQYRENGKETQTWWGHAVSEDLLHWKELDVALKCENEKEDVGCWSGSAIVKEERLYLFYTSVSTKYGQTISIAYTDDGVVFHRYANNPIISVSPLGHNEHFRDPKVFQYNDKYYMLVATELGDSGKILCYTSNDLFDWEYSHEFYSSNKYYRQKSMATLECPDFFPVEDKWVLKFSSQKHRTDIFSVGVFNGKNFIPEIEDCFVDAGNELFAIQTFANIQERVVAIGWMWNWEKPTTTGYETRTGTMTIPREITVKKGKVYNYPVKEARHLLVTESKYVQVNDTILTVFGEHGQIVLNKDLKDYNGLKQIEQVEILHDGDALEIFVNEGEVSITQWLK